MAVFDVNNLSSFLGVQVLVNISHDDCSEWYLGVVIGFCVFVPDVYEFPHLLILTPWNKYPQEFFFEDIVSITPLNVSRFKLN